MFNMNGSRIIVDFRNGKRKQIKNVTHVVIRYGGDIVAYGAETRRSSGVYFLGKAGEKSCIITIFGDGK